MMVSERVPGSFRDPSGFVFRQDDQIYRQVNRLYQGNYDRLIASGLYAALIESGLLIPHEEVDSPRQNAQDLYKTLKPTPIPFISYPYEWCFSQWKQAALTTLEIQKRALEHGMSLKDASAYNIQFLHGKPIFIDTLSFEQYTEGKPWIAYRQFCQHFLAPLALMSRVDIRLGQLSRIHIDGIPLDLASALLPFATRSNLALLTHIHLHAGSQKSHAGKATTGQAGNVSRMGLLGILDQLESAVRKLNWNPAGTEWADYYEGTNYDDVAMDHKKRIIGGFLQQIAPRRVWDVGANTGVFSRIASSQGIETIAFDIDPAAVEKNYREVIAKQETNLLPLLLDVTNPSPGTGWANTERSSLRERGPADAAFALALVHHLALTHNIPLERIAQFFSEICEHLVIEFVPKSDSQAQRLLASREDIFTEYDQPHFEDAFLQCFQIRERAAIENSQRTLYLMHRL